MDRIEKTFARARSENRACFVVYLAAGDPDFDTSLAASLSVLENGADILELGVPFSDPAADGLTNQLAAQRALGSGMTAARVLELAAAIRRKSDAPLIFYTYYNLIFAHGVDAYARMAKEAGIDGLLVLDLPPEESAEMDAACEKYGLKSVRIIAPTTPEDRVAKICAATTGFIYYVSREGVTGVRAQLSTDIPEAIARIRKHTSRPVVVGFGISTREHVATVSAHADGAVVGSALVNIVRDHVSAREKVAPALAAKTRDLAAGTKR